MEVSLLHWLSDTQHGHTDTMMKQEKRPGKVQSRIVLGRRISSLGYWSLLLISMEVDYFFFTSENEHFVILQVGNIEGTIRGLH